MQIFEYCRAKDDVQFVIAELYDKANEIKEFQLVEPHIKDIFEQYENTSLIAEKLAIQFRYSPK